MKPPRVRVLHIVASLGLGGVEAWLNQLVPRLIRHGIQTDICVSVTGGWYESSIMNNGGRVITGPSYDNYLSWAIEFRKLLKDEGPYDIVHSHMWFASGAILTAARMCDIPVRIAHSRNTGDVNDKTWRRRLYIAAARNLINMNASHTMAISKAAARSLFGTKRLSRCQFVPTAIDLEPFYSPTVSNYRSQLGIPESSQVIVNIGSMTVQKNHSFVVNVASRVMQRNKDTYLLLVGDGPRKEMTTELLRANGLESRTILISSSSDVPSLLKGVADVLLFPSLWEGFGRVVVEAQAAAVPCVISDPVPEEATVIPGLVRRVSLEEPVEDWADAVEAALGTNIISQDEALALVSQSPYNMDVAAVKLAAAYFEAMS